MAFVVISLHHERQKMTRWMIFPSFFCRSVNCVFGRRPFSVIVVPSLNFPIAFSNACCSTKSKPSRKPSISSSTKRPGNAKRANPKKRTTIILHRYSPLPEEGLERSGGGRRREQKNKMGTLNSEIVTHFDYKFWLTKQTKKPKKNICLNWLTLYRNYANCCAFLLLVFAAAMGIVCK